MRAALERLARWWRRAESTGTPHDADKPGPHASRVLLLGWLAPLPPGVRGVSDLPAAEQAEIGALWTGGMPAIAAAWREHAAWLEAEGARLRLPRLCSRGGRLMYFGEFVSTGMSPATGRQR